MLNNILTQLLVGLLLLPLGLFLQAIITSGDIDTAIMVWIALIELVVVGLILIKK